MPSPLAILLSRIRLPAFAVSAGLIIADRFVGVLPDSWLTGLASLAVLAVLL